MTPMKPLQIPPLISMVVAFLAGHSSLLAATPAWDAVLALDAPLPRVSGDEGKAKARFRDHLERQLAVTERFLEENPGDGHTYDARVRIEVIRARLASMEGNAPTVNAALTRLMALEKEAPDPDRKADATFRRISLQWQNLGDTPDLRRENAVASAEKFALEFPGDRRAPRLLAEAESLCDNHPEEKARLVDQALALSHDEPMTKRLLDDRRRLDLLGKALDLSFTGIDGRNVNLAACRGKVTALVFWSAESAPSLVWMNYFRKFADGIPGLAVVTVSLDTDENDLRAAMNSLGIGAWPVAFDGKGWKNTIARRFGINVLPTLWLLDKQGRLQALNARENYENRIRELLLRN